MFLYTDNFKCFIGEYGHTTVSYCFGDTVCSVMDEEMFLKIRDYGLDRDGDTYIFNIDTFEESIKETKHYNAEEDKYTYNIFNIIESLWADLQYYCAAYFQKELNTARWPVIKEISWIRERDGVIISYAPFDEVSDEELE
tara:strand:+ start:9686 stop:10105 length:420 start_codon:yes stop_codon:yes gene_type:complete